MLNKLTKVTPKNGTPYTVPIQIVKPGEWFEPKYGWLVRHIPRACVRDCSHSGDCYEDVEYWRKRLERLRSIAIQAVEGQQMDPSGDPLMDQLGSIHADIEIAIALNAALNS